MTFAAIIAFSFEYLSMQNELPANANVFPSAKAAQRTVTTVEVQEESTPETEPEVEPTVQTIKYEERYPSVPLLIQQNYRESYGGHGTVATHGCGICSVAMVFSYLLDRDVSPATLAADYGRHNTEHGSSWTLFMDTAEGYGIEKPQQVFNWSEVKEALEAGHLVIANAGPNSLFTQGGHFIVLTGVTEEGRFLVNDPNLYNYPKKRIGSPNSRNDILYEGLCEGRGFEERHVRNGFYCWWIYPFKDYHTIVDNYMLTQSANIPEPA